MTPSSEVIVLREKCGRLSRRVGELEAVLRAYQLYFSKGLYQRRVDHACIRCDPEATGAAVAEGFRCPFHRGEALL